VAAVRWQRIGGVWVTAALVAAYGLTLALCSQPGYPSVIDHGEPWPYLADKPLGEDAYYMLTIGWNLGAGDGLSYAPPTPATGIQLLSTVAYGGVAWVVQQAGGDRWAFARAALLLMVGEFILFAVLAGRVAAALSGAAAAAGITTLLVLTSYPLFRQFTYGLETGLYLVVLSIAVLFTLHHPPATWNGRDAAAFGLLASVAVLVRLDFLVVGGLLLMLGLATRMVMARAAVITALAGLAAIAPWFWWVHRATGRWLPTSAYSQMELVTAASLPERARATIAALVQHALPPVNVDIVMSLVSSSVPPALRDIVLAMLAIGMAAAAAALLAAGVRRIESPRARTAAVWIVATMGLVAIYPTMFWPTYFFARYTAPTVALLVPIVGIGLASVVERAAARRVCVLALPALFAVYAWATLHRGHVGNPVALVGSYVAGLPAGVQVGAFSSGVTGYIRPASNLDGKVNLQALQALEAGRLPAYIDHVGIDRLVQWNREIEFFLPASYLASQWRPCAPGEQPPPVTCYTRVERPQ
jgi:hypothetical protein